MSRPFPPRHPSASQQIRVNGKIRAREVRVIGHDGSQIGVIPLSDALNMARQHGVDLVEIAATANPPVCRIVDFGKYRYELAKRDKESKKHQHSNKVKEIQLSPQIDPHDFKVKLAHAIDFLCEEMKVKVTLRFRGREMAHKEYGFQQVQKLIQEVAPYGHPDQPPKLVGRGITAMLSPLPRTKRAKNPRQAEIDAENAAAARAGGGKGGASKAAASNAASRPHQKDEDEDGDEDSSDEFKNNPFAELDARGQGTDGADGESDSTDMPPPGSGADSGAGEANSDRA